MADTIRILHVDDDPDFRDLTADFLEEIDGRFEVVSEPDARAALDRLQEERDDIDCIVSDYQMPKTDGIEFLETVRRRYPDLPTPFVLLTGKGSEDIAAEALNAGASSYIQKGTADVYEYVARRILNDVRTAQYHRDSMRFDTLVSAIDDPVYVLDESGQFTYVNEAFLELTGYDRSEVLGETPDLIKDQAAVEAAERHLRRLLSENGPSHVSFEVEIQPKSGEPIACEDHMGVLPYEGEEFQGSIGVLRDITERKERERKLAEAKDRYQLLVEQNLVGLYITRGTELVYHNEQFAALFGRSTDANALVGESLLDFVEPADRDRLEENLTQAEAGRIDSLRQPYVGLTPDNERINIELLARGIDLEDEPAVLGTVVDVGKDEEQYWELRRERDRLDEFISIVSHDLRNPLGVASGQLELAKMVGEFDDETAEAISKASEALDRMEELLDDLLKLARQGQTVDDREPVGLRELAESTWRNVETGDAQLHVTATGTINADPSRIKGVFENLYRNSVEHGSTSSRTQSDDSVEQTTPDVTVRVGDLEDGFFVADDGPGIPEAERDEVFESGYTTAKDGTGFGLAIVKETVQAHGWRIEITESSDGGARFEIRADEHRVRSGDESNKRRTRGSPS